MPVNDFECQAPSSSEAAQMSCQGAGARFVSAEPPVKSLLWSLLNDWATRQGVDGDLALLICACAAAHAAGPRLVFEGRTEFDHLPAPTLIAEAGYTGFYQAVRAAIEPLLAIQRDRIAQHGEPDEKVFRKPPMSLPEKINAEILSDGCRFFPHLRNPARDLVPDKQPAGPVRFVLEGALPAEPVEFLKRCHLYSALSVAEIEKLPVSRRSREARLGRIVRAVSGYHRGLISIRGFMRFTREDLDWMLANDRDLIHMTLPFDVQEAPRPVPPVDQTDEQPAFARFHEATLRRLIDLRFTRAECDADFRSAGARRMHTTAPGPTPMDFRSAEAHHWFQKLRERYRSEDYLVAHVDKMCLILPDLFAWYALQLAQSAGLDIDEQELAGHAIAAARRLRRQVAGFYDRHEAVRRARQRLALAPKLVARMRSLNRPCKRRDLARGFDNQRLDRLDPPIDRLVKIGVFSQNAKWLCPGPAWETRILRLEDFMEPPEKVPFSVTLRLTNVEQAKSEAAQIDAEIERLPAGGNHGAVLSRAL